MSAIPGRSLGLHWTSPGGAGLVIQTGFICAGTGSMISIRAGFRRSTEMTLFFPLIKRVKRLLWEITSKGPSYGCWSGDLTLSCLIKTWLQSERILWIKQPITCNFDFIDSDQVRLSLK
ncbi:hypothetical protein TNCT_369221 [Trichonephila clavata]|uniref:Uncharacterized protein n=1 Tax=Trichonephila clavata TaxID=2740835 RepID=A0A8X6G4K3_TRICU|nr:hypothetical protein TNCT_369221 [Trichonephila clavata]